MRKNILTPLIVAAFFTASATSTAFAATNRTNASTSAQRVAPAQAGKPNQTRQPVGQQPGDRQMQVTYYRGDPLNGGQRLNTVTVNPPAPAARSAAGQRTHPLVQNAPQGATHAVITTPSGQRVVNLNDAQAQGGLRRGEDRDRGPRGGEGRGGQRDGQDGRQIPGDRDGDRDRKGGHLPPRR